MLGVFFCLLAGEAGLGDVDQGLVVWHFNGLLGASAQHYVAV